MSNIELPAPLVPAWIDLLSYDWFPFFHKRLRQSAFWKSASDLACRISVDLWSEAYEQVPAGSIPNNDHILSEWAGFGRRDLSGWLAVKDEVLSAWTLCSDGRWYHRTLGEVACQAGVERRRHLWARECDRIRKENVRRQKAGLPALDAPPKPSDDPWQDGAFTPAATDDAESGSGRPADVHGTSDGRPAEGSGNPLENALTRTRTRTETIREGGGNAAADPPPPVADDLPPKPKRSRGKPAKADTEFPPDFALTPELAVHASRAGYDPPALFERFRDKALARGWAYRDWSAAFRTFVATEQRYAPPPARPNGVHRPPDC